MSEKKNGVLYLVGGILIGGLIGAGVAMLTAPQSGMQTRTMIKEKSVDIKNKVAVGAGETRERAGKALTDLRGRAEEVVRNMRKAMPTQKDNSMDLTEPMIGSESL